MQRHRKQSNRNEQLVRALQMLEIIESHRTFVHSDVMEGMEIHRRTAYRWIESAEALGLIECDAGQQRRKRPYNVIWRKV